VGAYKPVPALSARALGRVYMQLAKSQLTILVTLTATAGVALSPLPTTVPVLLSTALGTALCSAAANTLNQLQEVPFDAQMARTRGRPLVRRAITPLHAAGFAFATGIGGPALLWTMVNPTTAVLGAANIVLYAGAYTYLKRKSVANTWVGAVVGGLPPLMGWTAAGGALLPSAEHPLALFPPTATALSAYAPPTDLAAASGPLGALALFLLLYSWQFPHFNAFSHYVRASYAQAGYRMLAVTDPARNAAVSLRHAAALIGICQGLIPLSGLTTWTFALTSAPVNVFLLHAAWRFYRSGSEKQARALFYHSLWYLPVVLGLMMVHKQGTDWKTWVGLTPDKEDQAQEGEQQQQRAS
jgi:protoheme IX farnesyltransferase